MTGKKKDEYFSRFIGKRVGSATIVKEIGRGGMGAVFLGRQESLQRDVAVKLLLPAMLEDQTARERFQREALAIAGLKSPYVVQIFDFGRLEETLYYIIMEFLPGRTLEQYLKRNGPFPPAKSLSVVMQVAMGLQAAHDAGLIHRDVKPSNIIMNNKGHVTLTDFGLVRPQKKITHTQTGILMGTPHYMSPEVTTDHPLDGRSDIYSLGIVFYHLLAGHPPFQSGTPLEILLKHLKEPLPDLRKTQPDIPTDLIDILERMTAKKPDERYVNCNELIWALRAAERKLTGQTSIITPLDGAPPLPEGTPRGHGPEPAINSVIDSSQYPGLNEVEHLFPGLFAPDNLLGATTLSGSGATLDTRGHITGEWKNTAYVLNETTGQLADCLHLGRRRLEVVESREEILALFPRGDNLEILLFNRKDTGTLSGGSLKNGSASFSDIDTDTDTDTGGGPLGQIAAIDGVMAVLLFNTDGHLADYCLGDREDHLEEYSRRFSPAAQIIQSISPPITGIDLRFEKGRLLAWKLENGIIFVIAATDINRPFLSIYITARFKRLTTAISSADLVATTRPTTRPTARPTTRPKAQKEKTVEEPVSQPLMGAVQLELARIIGPIAKILLSKETKKMGYSRDRFPRELLLTLAKKLADRIDQPKGQQFIEKIQDLIYESEKTGEPGGS